MKADPDKDQQLNLLISSDLDRDVIEGFLCLRTCLAMQDFQRQRSQIEGAQPATEVVNCNTNVVLRA
jgi:hypothetical protein